MLGRRFAIATQNNKPNKFEKIHASNHHSSTQRPTVHITNMSATTAASFAGKVVLITGASSGIGAATAVHLAKLGARLCLAGRNVANLERVAQECVGDKAGKLIVSGDVTNELDTKRLIDETIAKFGESQTHIFSMM